MKSLSYVSALLLAAVASATAQVLTGPQQGTGTQFTGTEGTGVTWGTTEAGGRVPMDQSMMWDRPMMGEQADVEFGRRLSVDTMCMVARDFCSNLREVAFNRPAFDAMCMSARNYCTSDRRSFLVPRDVSEVEAAHRHGGGHHHGGHHHGGHHHGGHHHGGHH